MNKRTIISVLILLLVGGILVAYKLNKRQEVIAHNAAVAAENAAQAAPSPAETAAPPPLPPSAPAAANDGLPHEPPAFITTTPVAKDAQLKLAEELVAKAAELWKQGDKIQSISAGNAALDIYDAQYGKKDERTVKLRVQITKAKMEVMMPNGK